MTYTFHIKHLMKGLKDEEFEIVFSESCDDECNKATFNKKYKKLKELAYEKFQLLHKEYKNEIFYLIELKHERKILQSTSFKEE